MLCTSSIIVPLRRARRYVAGMCLVAVISSLQQPAALGIMLEPGALDPDQGPAAVANAICDIFNPCNDPDCDTGFKCFAGCYGNALCAPICGGNPCVCDACGPTCNPQCNIFCPQYSACACHGQCSILCDVLAPSCNPACGPLIHPACNAICGGNICSPNCPTSRCDILCNPSAPLCDPACGGNPCNIGCGNACNFNVCPGNRCNVFCGADLVCDPVCGGNRCNLPTCPGYTSCECAGGNNPCNIFCDPLGPICNTQCNPLIAPACNAICGGNICSPNCPTSRCDILCNPLAPLCDPACGGDPCNIGCPNACDFNACPSNICNLFCPGGGPCVKGCITYCDPLICIGNACNPDCGPNCNPFTCPQTACDFSACPLNRCSVFCGADLVCDPVCGGDPCNLPTCPGYSSCECIGDNDPCNIFCDPLGPTCNSQCNPLIPPGCNPICGGDVCSPNCPGSDCNVLCGHDLCSNPNCSDYCDPFLCAGNAHCNAACGGDRCSELCLAATFNFDRFCSPTVCPENDNCNLICGGNPCNSGCPDACTIGSGCVGPPQCSPSCGADPCSTLCAAVDVFTGFSNFCDPGLCPQNASCNLICGGDPCNSGCPDECTVGGGCVGPPQCDPSCGADPCSAECAAVDAFTGLTRFCDPTSCPENDKCNILCGGSPCADGCPCSPIICLTECDPDCGGDPCSLACAAADGASFSSLDDHFCNPTQCPQNDRCNLICGGNPCLDGCPDACTILCPQNLNCDPDCGGNPNNFGCPPVDCDINPCQTTCDNVVCNQGCPQYNACACAGNDPCNAACGNPCAAGCPGANSCACNPCGATCQPECKEACPQYNLCTCLGTDPCECDPCGAGCPAPGCMQGLQPGDLAIDARAPSNLAGDQLLGWDSLMVRFGGDASSVTAAQFATAVTGGVQPFVFNAAPAGTDVQLQLTSRIPPGERSTIEHAPTHSSTCLAFLPGDVNGNGSVNTVDGFALRAMLNNIPATLPVPHKADLDHSGAATAEDVIMWLNIVNGGGALDPWLGATLPTPCPVVSPVPRPADESSSGTR